MMSLLAGHASAQQPAILTTANDSDRAVVFPDTSVPGTQNLVPGLPANAQPHGVAYYGRDNALISDLGAFRVFDVRVSTASLVSTITTSPNCNGSGTIAVAPDLTAALSSGLTSSLHVIHAPFGPTSTITTLPLPALSFIKVYQTQAIVFDNAGRAFVYHTQGISVLDAPYTSIVFTIPVSGNANSGAIAISPDGNTLLTTTLSGNEVRIFQAPFSAASTSTNLTIPGGVNLDGIMIAPNGANAIVVSDAARHAAAIIAPFSSSSTVETFTLPAGNALGFEDVGISADSQIAILAGEGVQEPPVFVRAPFTAAAVPFYVPIMGLPSSGRGNGAVRFPPPGLAPGLTISKSAPATVAPGANLTYTISYSNTGTANAANVVIRDPLPAGTTFVSATNGGTLIAGNVVFNIGTVNGGAGTQTVSFTVTVNTPGGGTVANNNYTIEGTGIFPIPGPPVTTTVTMASPTPSPSPPPAAQTINLSTRMRVQTGDNVGIGGFIITGTAPKHVLLRAIGPSLTPLGVPDALADPVLELHGPGAFITITNDNWRDDPAQEAAIIATGIAPTNNFESAIDATLNPQAYTAIVRGKNDTSGVGLIEVYDLNQAVASKLANISTRAFVDTGNNIVIAGFILGNGSGSDRVIVRGIGPSLTAVGVPNALADPTLELRDANGALLIANNDWQDNPTQAALLTAAGLAPTNNLESGIAATLPPGLYTALLAGLNSVTGIGLVEVYDLGL